MNKFIASLIFISLSSCNIIKDKGSDDVGAKKLVSSNSVQLMRVNSGTQLNFSLRATRPINCEVVYWENSDNTSTDTSANAKKHACQTDDIYKTIISTNIENLNPNSIYRFKVRAWSEDAANLIEETDVLESTNNSFSITNKEFYHVKAQLNKDIGGVFAYNPSNQSSFNSLETGCQNNLTEPEALANPLYADDVTFTGFTNTKGRNLQLPNPFVQFSISSKNYDLPLNVAIQNSLGASNLNFRSPLAFKSLEVSSINKISVPSYREGDTPPSIRSSNGDSLNLTWTNKGKAPIGYLNAHIYNLNGERLLTCRYNAYDGSASINDPIIKNLNVGSYRVSLELKSFDTDQNSNSIMTSSDWRVLIFKRS